MSAAIAPGESDEEREFARVLLFLAHRHRLFFLNPNDPRGLAPPDNAPPVYAKGIAMAIEVLNDDDLRRELQRKGRSAPAEIIPFASTEKEQQR